VIDVEAEPTVEPATKPVHPLALWAWGRLLDFERMGVLDSDPEALLETMLDHMQETTQELAPQVALWLERLGRHKNEFEGRQALRDHRDSLCRSSTSVVNEAPTARSQPWAACSAFSASSWTII
jgi:hypothetical protein